MEDIANKNARVIVDGLLAGQPQMPGARDSVILAVDSVLTIVRLFKSEAALALKNLPTLLALDVYRIPAHLLTWISFCMLAACAVQTWTENLLLSVGAFFLLQLTVTVVLEMKARQLRDKVSFNETRKGVSMMYASLKERFQDEEQA
jgi:hypothetical protein